MENIVCLRLDDYLHIRNGEITIQVFVDFINLYIDPYSDFSKWIQKNPISNPRMILNKFIGSPLFNEDIYSIKHKIKILFNNAKKNSNSVENNIVDVRQLQKIYGGNFNADTFCASVLKFLFTDIDKKGKYAEDVFAKSIRYYASGLVLLEKIYKEQGYSNDLLYFIELLFKHVFFSLKKNNSVNEYVYSNYRSLCFCILEYFLPILNDIFQNVNDKIVTVDESLTSLLGFSDLPNLQKSKSVELLTLIIKLIEEPEDEKLEKYYKMTLSIFMNQIPLTADEISYIHSLQKYTNNLITFFKHQSLFSRYLSKKSLLQNKEIYSDEDLEYVTETVRTLNIKIANITENIKIINLDNKTLSENLSDLKNKLSYETVQYFVKDKSGTEKSEQRLIFLIKTAKSGSYAVKLATDAYIQYVIEGEIYSTLKKIIEDPDEPKRDIIKNSTINCYNYYSLIKHNNNLGGYLIKIKDNLDIKVTQKTNSKIFRAINNIAKINNTTSVIYYVTENLVGTGWSSLDDLICTKKDKCNIANKTLNLLHYLNKNYSFSHWDLHPGNIFVNINNLDNIKIYDFDYSEIQNINSSVSKNNLLIDTINNYVADQYYSGDIDDLSVIFDIFEVIRISDSSRRRKYGMIFDIYRVLFTFVTKNTCDDDIKELFNIYNSILKLYETELEYINDYTKYFLNHIVVAYHAVKDIQYYNKIVSKFRNMLSGGNYKQKYLAYKKKYLELKKIY